MKSPSKSTPSNSFLGTLKRPLTLHVSTSIFFCLDAIFENTLILSRDETSVAFTCRKVVPARRVSLSVDASHPGQFLPRDKPKYHVNRTVVLGNMPRRFLPRDNSLSGDNMLSQVHVNRVLDLLGLLQYTRAKDRHFQKHG